MLKELQELYTQLDARQGDGEAAELNLRLGELNLRLGALPEAVSRLSHARRGFLVMQEGILALEADLHLADTQSLKGDHEAAIRRLDEGISLAQSRGAEELRARLLSKLAEVKSRKGDLLEAEQLWEQAKLDLFRFNNATEMAWVYAGLSWMRAEKGLNSEATELATKALEEAGRSGDPLALGRALVRRAQALGLEKESSLADSYFHRAIEHLEEFELRRELAEACLAYGAFLGKDRDEKGELQGVPATWLARSQELFREFGTLADLDRVKDALRLYGRRATDKIVDPNAKVLIQKFSLNRRQIFTSGQQLLSLANTYFASTEGTVAVAKQGELAFLQESCEALSSSLGAMFELEERITDSVNAALLDRNNARMLLEFCRSLTAVTDATQLPDDAARISAQLTGADRVLIVLFDAEGDLTTWASRQISPEDVEAKKTIRAKLLSDARPSLIGVAHSKPSRPQDLGNLGARGGQDDSATLGGQLVCPLYRNGVAFGAVYCDKALVGGVFSLRELDLLSAFCSNLATIVDNRQVHQEIRIASRTQMATLDAISDGVLSIRPDGTVTSINRAARRILGVQPRHISEIAELAFLGPSAREGHEFDGRTLHLSTGDFLVSARCVEGEDRRHGDLIAVITEMKRVTSMAMKLVGSPARYTFADIVGRAPVFIRQMERGESACRSESSVLITGESGTGKEVIAQAIHNGGPRAPFPYVGINCAAIPRELLESELFGHEPGSFTGARKGVHPGKFELAENGTLLLDEIGDMPLDMQAKLLRVLQERRVHRLGGTKDIHLNTRIIATTNRDLADEVKRGHFRQDLYYRLRVIHVQLPSLRERREDIPLLLNHFVRIFSKRLGKSVRGLTPRVLEALTQYDWPGNIRELEHCVESEVNLVPAGKELLDDIPLFLAPSPLKPLPHGEGAEGGAELSQSGAGSLAQSEEQILLDALKAHNGSIIAAAAALGVSRGTVYNRLKKLNIDVSRFRARGTDGHDEADGESSAETVVDKTTSAAAREIVKGNA